MSAAEWFAMVWPLLTATESRQMNAAYDRAFATAYKARCPESTCETLALIGARQWFATWFGTGSA